MKPRADFYTTKAGYTQSWCRKCSQASKNEWRRANSAEYNARRALKFDRDRACAVCGVEYRAIARRQSRCGPCHDANRKVPVVLTCQTCSLPITTTNGRTKYHLECRPLIVNAAAARAGKAKAKAEMNEARAFAAETRAIAAIAARTRSCAACGAPFVARHGRRRCSDECGRAAAPERVLACARCGVEFATKRASKACCSAKCYRGLARDRRRARERDAYVEDVWRAKVYARDGYTCQLCRRPVRMDKQVPHPKAPTLDHRIPLAAGGEHSYANVQLAHFLCNSVKSAGDAQLVLGLMGW